MHMEDKRHGARWGCGEGDEFEQMGMAQLYGSAAMKSVALYATVKKNKT